MSRKRYLKLPSQVAIDMAVMDFFRTNEERKARLVAVIPAFKEEDSVAEVVKTLPPSVAGIPLVPLVVVDGDFDATADRARAAGALVAVLPGNFGQGAAFRAGYRIAVRLGAEYVITLDADGQSDPAELEAVLAPVLEGHAELVVGSRVKGADLTGNRLRAAGVRVFSWLIFHLTGLAVTDPANPLRAMRACVPGALDLVQDQFQAPELMIRSFLAGYRVAEVPVTMRKRVSGASKKGGSLRYGLGFARSVMSSYWAGRNARRRP